MGHACNKEDCLSVVSLLHFQEDILQHGRLSSFASIDQVFQFGWHRVLQVILLHITYYLKNSISAELKSLHMLFLFNRCIIIVHKGQCTACTSRVQRDSRYSPHLRIHTVCRRHINRLTWQLIWYFNM